MSDLLVIVFDDQDTARAMHAAMARMGADHVMDLADLELVVRDGDGGIRFGASKAQVPARALGGGIWGLVLGAVFTVPVAGAAVGAAAGALTGLDSAIGIEDAFLDALGRTLLPGSAAVCVMVRDVSVDEMLERLRGFHETGHVIRAPLAPEDAGRLRRLVEGEELARDIARDPAAGA